MILNNMNYTREQIVNAKTLTIKEKNTLLTVVAGSIGKFSDLSITPIMSGIHKLTA